MFAFSANQKFCVHPPRNQDKTAMETLCGDNGLVKGAQRTWCIRWFAPSSAADALAYLDACPPKDHPKLAHEMEIDYCGENARSRAGDKAEDVTQICKRVHDAQAEAEKEAKAQQAAKDQAKANGKKTKEEQAQEKKDKEAKASEEKNAEDVEGVPEDVEKTEMGLCDQEVDALMQLSANQTSRANLRAIVGHLNEIHGCLVEKEFGLPDFYGYWLKNYPTLRNNFTRLQTSGLLAGKALSEIVQIMSNFNDIATQALQDLKQQPETKSGNSQATAASGKGQKVKGAQAASADTADAIAVN